MSHHELLDGSTSPETTLRRAPIDEETAILEGLPTIVRWPAVDPDEVAKQARHALYQRQQPSIELLEHVLTGLRTLT